MKYVISPQLMKSLDSKATEEYGLSSRLLMENAGHACASRIITILSPYKSMVSVCCGSGNNGGDGYVIARWLTDMGCKVQIVAWDTAKSSKETLANKEVCEKMGIPIHPVYSDKARYALLHSKVIIDAIFGIGFKGAPDEQLCRLLEMMNELDALRITIDISTGVNSHTGEVVTAFRAHHTLALAAYKYGHLLGKGREYSGELHLIPIGIPAPLWQDVSSYLYDDGQVTYPERSAYAHKGDYGRVSVFAGAPGMTGAAFMSSMAAVKAGAGLVTIMAYPAWQAFYNEKPWEVMVDGVPLDEGGNVEEDKLAEKLERCDVILFGPGMGVSEYTYQLIKYLLSEWDKPLIIDADGINALSANPELIPLLKQKPNVLLTPHVGEFSRLIGCGVSDIKQDTLGALDRWMQDNKSLLLLKSDVSILCEGKQRVFINRGNDGLATGGSGDVLGGLIAGFSAQIQPLRQAAALASWVLGETAERLSHEYTTFSLSPSLILANIFRRGN